MDVGEIIKVGLMNLSQRHKIVMWPVYVDQDGAIGKRTLFVGPHTSCADTAALMLVILDLMAMHFSVFDPLPGLSSSFPKHDYPDEARNFDQ